jgi:hypothetical protein
MNTDTNHTIENIAGPEVTVRVSRAADARALARLAVIDSAELIEGPALIAELDGKLVAAVPIDGGPGIADPFVRTAALVEMLEFRAAQIRRAQAGNVTQLRRRLTRTAPHAA